MGSCQIWWKNLLESGWKNCGTGVEKLANKYRFYKFDHTGRWKRISNCELNNIFVNISRGCSGKEKQIKRRIFSDISTTST